MKHVNQVILSAIIVCIVPYVSFATQTKLTTCQINETYETVANNFENPTSQQEKVTRIGKYFTHHNLKIVTAESITAGGLAYTFTEIPGSSKWFDRGFVTYNDEAKHDMLRVKTSTLKKYTAVSKAVAREMVAGAVKHSEANIGIACTGYAGPTGKQVGLVYIAYAWKNGTIEVNKHFFSGHRDEIRAQTIQAVITKLYNYCIE